MAQDLLAILVSARPITANARDAMSNNIQVLLVRVGFGSFAVSGDLGDELMCLCATVTRDRRRKVSPSCVFKAGELFCSRTLS